jgi:hypothetical protein
MSGNSLTTASSLMCPHGGTVSVSTSNTRVKANAYLVTSSDTFTVAGCAFTLPNGQPSPCTSVKWIVSDTRVSVGGATLSASSTGLCMNATSIPQGPVSIASTQPKVSSQ